MPRYFFHFHNALDAMDPEGELLPDSDAARGEAIDIAREVAADMASQGVLDLDCHVEVCDENGTVLATVPFRDVVLKKADC